MNIRLPSSKAVDQRGLTLLEIMVSSALLLVIVLGLTAMFTQTQRAFRQSLHNVDTFEGARATLDLVARDVAQMNRARCTNLFMTNIISPAGLPINAATQALPGTVAALQEFCFLTQISNNWTAVGYTLWGTSISNGIGIGELYRYSMSYPTLNYATNYLADYRSNFARCFYVYPPPTNFQFSRVIDGVVHMKINVFDTNGWPAYTNTGSSFIDASNFPPNTTFALQTNGFTFSNGVPGYVNLELGILDPATVEQLKGLPLVENIQLPFITNHGAQVQLFRQQVAIPIARQ